MPTRLLFANTFLLRVPAPWPVGERSHLHAKPAVRPRAEEYGPRLAGDYDVLALCEVFQDADLDRILAGWPEERRPEVARGPRSGLLAAGSGLATLVDGPELRRSGTHRFSGQGRRLRDSDAWANKGVLMVEVGLPDGRGLEVYSTHLIWGGDWFDTAAYRTTRSATRLGQAAELFDFVARRRRPGNAVVVTGDFNIAAGDEDGDRLADLAADAGFTDAWSAHGTGPGYTCDLWLAGHAIGTPDPEDERFALDPAPEADGAVRIDYAFVDDETVDAVTCVRRRALSRHPDAPEHHILPWLSDHLALHLELDL